MTTYYRLTFIVLILMVLEGCQSKAPRTDLMRYRQTRLAMGTVVSLDICAKAELKSAIESAYQDAWKKIEEFNGLMNIYERDTEVNYVSRSYLKPVTVSPILYTLISKSIAYSRLTAGAFDIVSLPLTWLWDSAQRENRFPPEEKVREVRGWCGCDKIQLLENNQVIMTHPEAMLDLGGIAKGFAVDAIADIFRGCGFRDFYIDAGGDVFASGHNCEDKPWRIGIKHPRYKNKVLNIINVSNMAVTTSGDYERFFYIEDQRFSHIINPITGYPQKGVVSATVIAPEAALSDALSTALCVLPPAIGLRIVDSLKDPVVALIVEQTPKGKLIIHKSQKYDKLFNN